MVPLQLLSENQTPIQRTFCAFRQQEKNENSSSETYSESSSHYFWFSYIMKKRVCLHWSSRAPMGSGNLITGTPIFFFFFNTHLMEVHVSFLQGYNLILKRTTSTNFCLVKIKSHQNSIIHEIVALLPGTKHLSTIPTVVTSFN